MSTQNRREFLQTLAMATGGVVLLPVVNRVALAQESLPLELEAFPVPTSPPEGWDPIAFNRDRGNAGAIPETYHASINGPDGETSHLGKHLPYVPEVDTELVPEGFIAIMWGDPAKGYTRHPNAPPNDSNNHEGHWYNWIRVRKAIDGEAEELQSTYTGWPVTGEDGSGAYAVFGGGDIAEDSGKNTIYLVALPSDVGPGDTLRIYAHCLTHGEYVDFISL